MKKCPNCGRSYSDMVQMCPACNVSLESGTIQKPVHNNTANEEPAAVPEAKATSTQSQKQKKTSIVVLALICAVAGYFGGRFAFIENPEPKKASASTAATIVEESLGSVPTDEITDLWELYELGLKYANGDGVEKNMEEAAKWYRLAADQGHVFSRNNLGACYYYGRGVQQDYAEAKKLFQLAAEKGDDYALYNLGLCYYYGRGVKQDYTESSRLFQMFKDRGHHGKLDTSILIHGAA